MSHEKETNNLNQTEARENPNEQPETQKEAKEFNREEVQKAGQEIHSKESINDFMAALRNTGKLVLANGEKIDCARWAGTVDNIARDIVVGKFSINKGCLFITRTLGLRHDFKKLIKKEISQNQEIKDKIKNAEGFLELYSILEDVGDIYSTNNTVSPNKWISAIESLRVAIKGVNIDLDEHPEVLNSLTRNMGLREKVKDLINRKK